MTTKVYGCSDDSIELKGDINGEISCFGTDEADKGVMLVFNDGTILEVKYGKNDEAIWEIKLINKGTKFSHIEQCHNEDADIYSDLAYFHSGLKKCYAAREWEKVK